MDAAKPAHLDDHERRDEDRDRRRVTELRDDMEAECRQVRRMSVAPSRDTRVGVEQCIVSADQIGERGKDETTEDGDAEGEGQRQPGRGLWIPARAEPRPHARAVARGLLDGFDDVAGNRGSSRGIVRDDRPCQHPGEYGDH